MVIERVYSEMPIRDIWNRLTFLESSEGSKRLLERRIKNEDISSYSKEIVAKKADGISFCIRSAREYFSASSEANITPIPLKYYYGTLALIEASLIANVGNEYTLEEIQNFTAEGHGLFTFSSDKEEFPASEKVGIWKQGFFRKFSEIALGVDLSSWVFSKNKPKRLSDVDKGDLTKLISFTDLIARIPETKGQYIETFQEHPEYISYDFNKGNSNGEGYITIRVSRNSTLLNSDKIKHILGQDLESTYGKLDQWLYPGEIGFTISVAKELVSNFRTYNSPLAPRCFIKPLWNFEGGNLIAFHLMLLYMLSIWVRYQPALWREIMEGKYQLYRPLILNYLITVERIVPNLVLDHLFDRSFIFGPTAYL